MKRHPLIVSALLLAGVVVLCLSSGREIVLVLDRISTAPLQSLVVGPLVYSPGALEVGEYPLETSRPDGTPADLRVDVDASGRLVLHTDGGSFALGTRIGPPYTNGRPDIPIAPDPGDKLSLDVERSLLAWPTPFLTNFMTGISPSWKRNLYYRLTWRKRDGAALDMVWRYEQWFYPGSGWASPMTTQEGATGLLRARVTAAAAASITGTNFTGTWVQANDARNCSVVQGFQFNADGTASVEWKAGALVEHRDGRWTSVGDTLDLAVNAPHTQTVPASTAVQIHGATAGADRLEVEITSNADRNIDGQPYTIRCAFSRRKS